MKSVGIIGFGAFGRFMAGHLSPFMDIVAYDGRQFNEPAGVRSAHLDEVARQRLVILSVPVQEMEGLLKRIGGMVLPEALVIDVASVKMLPVELMKRYLPETCQIVATHPLFGPQSGGKGIEGLTVVTWPVRVEDNTYGKLKDFLAGQLGLKVEETSPEDHDAQMAYVQALTFFIGRGLAVMQLPDSALKTATYQHLLEIQRIVESGTPELFETIQQGNPRAKEVRERFLHELSKIEQALGDSGRNSAI